MECTTLSDNGERILEVISKVEDDLNISIVVTSGNRSREDQLEIMLERQNNYRICERFRMEFGIAKVPENRYDLTCEQLEWWKQNILARANSYFPHVGGNAIDIRVFNFSVAMRAKLKKLFEEYGVSVILEAPPEYNVSIEASIMYEACHAP